MDNGIDGQGAPRLHQPGKCAENEAYGLKKGKVVRLICIQNDDPRGHSRAATSCRIFRAAPALALSAADRKAGN
jgi:hypothetical protein